MPALDVGPLRWENQRHHGDCHDDSPAAYLTTNATSRSFATSCATSARGFFVGPGAGCTQGMRRRSKMGTAQRGSGDDMERGRLALPCDPSPMQFDKHSSHVPLVLTDRTWPDHQLTRPPRWPSVDLRDGNQALIDPMDPERKLALFKTLIDVGL